jgi:hypothetical protein
VQFVPRLSTDVDSIKDTKFVKVVTMLAVCLFKKFGSTILVVRVDSFSFTFPRRSFEVLSDLYKIFTIHSALVLHLRIYSAELSSYFLHSPNIFSHFPTKAFTCFSVSDAEQLTI